MYRTFPVVSLLLSLFLPFSSGCRKKEEAPPPRTSQAPSPTTTITLSFSPTSQIADGVSPVTITATVKKPDGSPFSATPVTWETSLGTFRESTNASYLTQTDSSGAVTATLVSSTAGIATVTLTAGGVRRSGTVEFTSPGGSTSGGSTSGGSTSGGSTSGGSTSGGPITGYIVLFVPQFADMGLNNSVSISGWAFDDKNHPLEGATVLFSLTSPTLSRSELGMITPSATVGKDGSFTGTYYGGLAPGTVTIVAEIGGVIRGYGTLTLVDRSPASLVVTAIPSSLDADGRSTSTISVLVLDGTGRAVPDGTLVNMTLLSGGGSLDKNQGTTVSGKVSAVYTAGSAGGTAIVRASSGSVSGSVSISLVDRSPRSLSLSVNPATLEQRSSAFVTATVLDGNNRPVLAGTTVTFTVTGITDAVVSPSSEETDSQGRATTSLFAGIVTGVGQIVAWAGGISGYSSFSVVQPAIGSIQFDSANPPVIGVRGSSQQGNSSIPEISVVRFKVLTSANTPVPDGTPVSFVLEGNLQTATLLVTTATTVGGVVETRVRSGTVAGVVRVIASAVYGGNTFLAPSINIVVQAGPPMYGHLNLSVKTEEFLIPGIPLDGLVQNFFIWVGDRYDNPVPDGTAVYFSSEAGIIEPYTPLSGGNGGVVLHSANPRPVMVDGSPPVPVIELSAGGWPPHNWTPVYRRPLNRQLDVVALVVGQEWFSDNNGNGYRDPGEAFIDVGEPFIDINGNGKFDSVVTDYSGVFTTMTEPFWDSVTENGQWDPGNGSYDPSNVLLMDDRKVFWTDDVRFGFVYQYLSQSFVDRNGNGRFDPGTDIILASKSNDPNNVTLCAPGVPTPPTVVGTISKAVPIRIWIGDTEGISLLHLGSRSVQVKGSGKTNTTSVPFTFSPSGNLFEIVVESTATQLDQAGFGSLDIVLDSSLNISASVPVCFAP